MRGGRPEKERASRRKPPRSVHRLGSAADKPDRTTAVGPHPGVGRHQGRRSDDAAVGEAANGSSSASVRADAARVRFVMASQPGTARRHRQRCGGRPRRLRAVCLREARGGHAQPRLGRVTSPGIVAAAASCGSRRRHRDRQASSRSEVNHITLTADEAITRPSRTLACTGRRRKAQGVERSTECSTHTGALFEPTQLRGIDATAVATAEDRS